MICTLSKLQYSINKISYVLGNQKKMNVTPFIKTFTLWQWSGPETMISPRSAHINLYCAACAKLLQLCPPICSPMDCSPPGSSIHGILQARASPTPLVKGGLYWGNTVLDDARRFEDRKKNDHFLKMKHH